MEFEIAVLPGDGIGPEVTQESVKILKVIEVQFGHKFNLTYGDIGGISIDKNGEVKWKGKILCRCVRV